MVLCKAIKADGTQCGAHRVAGSEFCFFHSPTVARKRNANITVSMRKASVKRKDGGRIRRYLTSKVLSERPRVERLLELERFYDAGGLIAKGIDSYVSVAIANKWQLIDNETGERETDNTKIIEELHNRVNLHNCFETMFRSMLIFGFVWGELDRKKTSSKKIEKLLFLPPSEIDIKRDESGEVISFRQMRAGKQIAEWKGKDLNDIFFINMPLKHQESFAKGLLERIYSEAKAWKDMGKDLGAVTKFVSYPFRVVKVGSDVYPASTDAVDKVGTEVEKLEPGDWLATRHNLEFEFHAPKIPEALILHYKETTKQLSVALGVPSLYTALEDIDANTLKEIRSIFNSVVQSLQTRVAEEFERQVIKRQFELLGKLKKRTDESPVKVAWNPLTVAVLSILELTQLVVAGVIGLEESRRILESMGYGLLRGDRWRDDVAIPLSPVKGGPKETHPTDDDPKKPPVKPPRKDTDTPPEKKKPTQPGIKRPQPNAPKGSEISYEQWLEGMDVLTKVDKYKASRMLRDVLEDGFKQTSTSSLPFSKIDIDNWNQTVNDVVEAVGKEINVNTDELRSALETVINLRLKEQNI